MCVLFRCVSLVKLYLPSDVSLDLSSDVCGRFSRTESIYLLCFCMWNLKERPFAQRRNVGFWKHIDARMRTKPFCLCITLCHSLCVSTKMTLRTKRQTQIYLFIISLLNSFWMNFFFSQWLLFAVLFSLCTHSDLMVSIVASWFFLLASLLSFPLWKRILFPVCTRCAQWDMAFFVCIGFALISGKLNRN